GASESNDAKSLIFGNHGRAFIRATRPPHRCVISLPCPTCGREVAYLEQYQRYYCYACGNYAPEGYGDRDAKNYLTARGILSYVGQYNRYYCDRCNAYPPDEAVLQSLEATLPVDVRPAPEASEPAVIAAEPQKTVETEKPIEAGKEVEVKKEPEVEEAAEPAVTATAATTATTAPTRQPEEIVEEEPPHEEAPGPRPRPPIVRLKVFQAKKPALMDLCKAYDLDPTGTKEQLRERLLSYLDSLEGEAEPQQGEEETAVQTEPVVAEPAAEVEQQSSPPSNETIEAASVEEEPAGEEPVSDSPQTVPTETLETRPFQEPVVERVETPVFVSVPETQPAVPVAPACDPD